MTARDTTAWIPNSWGTWPARCSSTSRRTSTPGNRMPGTQAGKPTLAWQVSEPSPVLRPKRLSLLDGLSLTTTAEGWTAPLPAPDRCELRDFRVGLVKAVFACTLAVHLSPVTGCPAATDGLDETGPTRTI